jgi:DNA-binding NarL/FixJ family response regulator
MLFSSKQSFLRLTLCRIILNKMQIILADSNELIRLGLRTILNSQSDISIVGEAKNHEELMAQLKTFGADVVLIDFTAHGFSIDTVPKALAKYKALRFVALTEAQHAPILIDALKSGVTSYVKKDCELTEIIDAVKETANGKQFFCGQILETIQKSNIDLDELNTEDFNCGPVVLSERENEIITLIAEGQTNEQIADMLFLSKHTVNTHRKNIMAKLGVKNTAGIVMYAVKTSLVSPNRFLFAPSLA